MADFTTTFKLKKETKGTYVYEEEDTIQPKIGTLYVKKYALGANPPARLTVSVKSGA